MKRFLSITAFCISATTAVAQTSDSRPTLWDFFTVERFATAFFNQLITYARAGADVRFDAVQVDPVAGLIRVTGLEVSPKIPGIDPDACTTDHFEVGSFFDELFGDLGGRTDGETIVLVDNGGERVFVFAEVWLKVDIDAAVAEDLHGGFREFVGDKNFRHVFVLLKERCA